MAHRVGVRMRIVRSQESFWDPTCRELIHKEIGLWLRKSGNAPWPPGHPPQFEMIPHEERRFLLKLSNDS